MISVEVFSHDNELEPLVGGTFAALPRMGEYVSIEAEGYFKYYRIIEAWHRLSEGTETFVPCVRVQLDD